MRSFSRLGFLFAILAVTSTSVCAQKNSTKSIEFNRDSFEQSMPIPHGVVQAILRTDTGKLGRQYYPGKSDAELAELFRAIEVRLGPPGETDLLVSGNGFMSGADNDWFWLVRLVPNRPKVVLWVGGHSIELRTTHTNGLADIRSEWNSPNEMVLSSFHFDGKKYVLVSEKWSEMPKN